MCQEETSYSLKVSVMSWVIVFSELIRLSFVPLSEQLDWWITLNIYNGRDKEMKRMTKVDPSFVPSHLYRGSLLPEKIIFKITSLSASPYRAPQDGLKHKAHEPQAKSASSAYTIEISTLGSSVRCRTQTIVVTNSLQLWLCRNRKLNGIMKVFKYVFSRNYMIIKILPQLLAWQVDFLRIYGKFDPQTTRIHRLTATIHLAPLHWPFSAEVKEGIEKSCPISHCMHSDFVPGNFLVTPWIPIYLLGMFVFILYVKNIDILSLLACAMERD